MIKIISIIFLLILCVFCFDATKRYWSIEGIKELVRSIKKIFQDISEIIHCMVLFGSHKSNVQQYDGICE